MARRLPRTRPLALLLLLPACAADPDAGGALEVGQAIREAKVCAGGPTVPGIDVSRFQGSINWQSVAGSGVKFAFIQISRCVTPVDGSQCIDPRFEENWANAKAAGVLRGAYQRFHPGQDVPTQAQIFLDKLAANGPGELPPVLDVEDADGLGPNAIANAVRQWMDIVEPEVGVAPIIYTGKYFWQDEVGGADLTEHPLWIAQWGVFCPDLPTPWTDWAFHQTSSTGRVPGISGDVDLDVFNGTIDDLIALGQGGDAEPCERIPAEGGVLDDTGPCFRAGGDPRFIRRENAGWGSELKWTHTTDLPNPANYGRWNIHLAEAGRYRVEAYTAAPWGESRMAVYQVQHAGQLSAAEVDQTAVDGWNLLGEFEFAAGGDQWIRVDDNTGEPNDTNTMLVMDAIRLTRLDGGGEVDGGDDDGDGGGDREIDPDGEMMTSGCTAAGGASGPAGLLLFLAFGALWLAAARRRRRA